MSGLESRLMDALSKLGSASGTGLKSDKIGPPPDELVKAFEEALNDLSQDANSNGLGAESNAFESQDSSTPQSIEFDKALHVEGTQSADTSMQGVDSTSKVDAKPNAQSIDNTNGVNKIDNGFEINSVNSSDAVDSKMNFRTEEVNKTQNTNQSKEPTTDELLKELSHVLETMSQPGASVSHMELFRVQYLVGMLKVQGQHGLKVSQTTTQGLENILKQQ